MKRHKLILIVAGLGCVGLLVVILAGGIGRESAALTGSSAPPNASVSFVGWQDLGPDEQASVYIPSPVWRMSFLCQARESKDGFREFFGRATPNSIVLPNAPNARPRLQIFSGARVSVLSPEVTP